MNESKRKVITFIALSACVTTIIVSFFNLLHLQQNYSLFIQYLATFAVVIIVIRYRKVPQKRVSKGFAYYFASFPLIIAVISLVLVYLVESFGGKIDPVLKIDMYFVTLSSLGAIFVMIITDKRIDLLESDFKKRID